jgi:hypothetical protein
MTTNLLLDSDLEHVVGGLSITKNYDKASPLTLDAGPGPVQPSPPTSVDVWQFVKAFG